LKAGFHEVVSWLPRSGEAERAELEVEGIQTNFLQFQCTARDRF